VNHLLELDQALAALRQEELVHVFVDVLPALELAPHLGAQLGARVGRRLGDYSEGVAVELDDLGFEGRGGGGDDVCEYLVLNQ